MAASFCLGLCTQGLTSLCKELCKELGSQLAKRMAAKLPQEGEPMLEDNSWQLKDHSKESLRQEKHMETAQIYSH